MDKDEYDEYKEKEGSDSVAELAETIQAERIEREKEATDREEAKAESEWLLIKRVVEKRIARPLRVTECVLGQPVTRTTDPHHILGWYDAWNPEVAALGLYGGFDLDGRFDT